MNRSKLAAIILFSLAVLWAAALFFGLPLLYKRKVDALVGHDVSTVRGQLGPPTQEWAGGAYPGDEAKGGPVLLYAHENQGFYLYFDASGRLATFERKTAPNPQ